MSETRKKKLAMLTRSIAQGDFARASQLLRTGKAGEGAEYRPHEPGHPLPLAEACQGAESMVEMPLGKSRYWLIRRNLEQISPEHMGVARQFAAALNGDSHLFLNCKIGDCPYLKPEDLLFMDVESCGFSGAMIFLVGMMYYADGQFQFEQYLARDYAEEAAILAAFTRRHKSAGVLVTYNGKAFDMNMIRDRSVFHGLSLPSAKTPHLDLLMEARKRWRGRLPNCKLQTLERYLCKRSRVGDIPGWAIADAYHKFVGSRDARQIRDIVHHNLLDLLTMGQLVCMFLTNYEPADLG